MTATIPSTKDTWRCSLGRSSAFASRLNSISRPKAARWWLGEPLKLLAAACLLLAVTVTFVLINRGGGPAGPNAGDRSRHAGRDQPATTLAQDAREIEGEVRTGAGIVRGPWRLPSEPERPSADQETPYTIGARTVIKLVIHPPRDGRFVVVRVLRTGWLPLPNEKAAVGGKDSFYGSIVSPGNQRLTSWCSPTNSGPIVGRHGQVHAPEGGERIRCDRTLGG